MGAVSKIEWTDATWNPLRGCTRVSPGCGGPNHQGQCYAEAIAARFSAPGQPFHGFAERSPHGGRWTGKVALIPELLDRPLRWRRPRNIFANSMSDLFHEGLPDEDIARIWAYMRGAYWHRFQVLTKRASRMRELVSSDRFQQMVEGYSEEVDEAAGEIGPYWRALANFENWPARNIWLGVSTENQECADERIPLLLDTPAAKRFISYEPALGPLDLTRLRHPGYTWLDALAGRAHEGCRLDWVIAGGESGPHARPAHPEWFRKVRDDCAAAGVPFFFKQWGEWGPIDHSEAADEAGWRGCGKWMIVDRGGGLDIPDGRWPDENAGEVAAIRVGKKRAGRLLDGIEHNGFPAP